MHAQTNPHDPYPDIETRLTILLGGRPFRFGRALDWILTGQYELQIDHEYSDKHVIVRFDENTLALTDDQLIERVLAPCLQNLDAASFPDRQTRFLAATRRLVECASKQRAA